MSLRFDKTIVIDPSSGGDSVYISVLQKNEENLDLVFGYLNELDQEGDIKLVNGSNVDSLHNHSLLKNSSGIPLLSALANEVLVAEGKALKFDGSPSGLLKVEHGKFQTNLDLAVEGYNVLSEETVLRTVLVGFDPRISALEAIDLLVLGESSTTAYRGDRGKLAYDHSNAAHAPSSAEQNVQPDWTAGSGDAHILNKPTIPAAQVQSDWNATAGVTFIKNKPSIEGAQVQSDWDVTSSADKAFIKHKPAVITAAEKATITHLTLSGSADIVCSTPVNLDTLSAPGGMYPPADATKVGYITVTQEVDLDTIESDTALNNAKVGITTGQASAITANTSKVTYPTADKNKLAGIASGAEVNVQSNWDAGSGDAHILNKPATITAGQASAIAANTAKLTYPAADKTKLAGIASGAEVNVQSDWNAGSGDSFIKNKPTTITAGQATAISTNTTKRSYPSADQAKVAALGSLANSDYTVSTGAPTGGSDGDLWLKV